MLLQSYILNEVTRQRPSVPLIDLIYDGDRETWLMDLTYPEAHRKTRYEFKVEGDPTEIHFVNVDDPFDSIRFPAPPLSLTYDSLDHLDFDRDPSVKERLRKLALEVVISLLQGIDTDEIIDTVDDTMEDHRIESTKFRDHLEDQTRALIADTINYLQPQAEPNHSIAYRFGVWTGRVLARLISR